jgi:hypothetical protein
LGDNDTRFAFAGPSRGGWRRGSGEAQVVSDFEVKKSISISMILGNQAIRDIFINYLTTNNLSKGGACGKNQYKA